MSKSIYFFATTADIQGVLAAAENVREIKYTCADTFEEPRETSYSSYKDIEHLGVALRGSQSQEAIYLVSDAQTKIVLREIQRRDGTIGYAVDQLLNPATVSLAPGGLFRDDCVIAGQVGTATTDKKSLELFNLIAREVRRRFKKVKSYWVGPEAFRILESGGRLTAGVKSPPEYDLKK